MPLSTKLDFEMTSELEGILKREVQAPGHRHIHPSLPADSKIIDEYLVLYDPAMKLPEPDDENALVAWLGLNENVSKIVLDDYKERLAGNVEEEFPVLRESENPGATLVHNLAAVFHANIDQQWQWDEAEDFEGYVNLAFHMGLKPEFALYCGLHPEKNCEVGEREQWYNVPPVHHVSDLTREYASTLIQVWRDREEYRSLKEKKTTEDENREVAT